MNEYRELSDIMKQMSQEAFKELIDVIREQQGQPKEASVERVAQIDREIESIFVNNFWVQGSRMPEAQAETDVRSFSILTYKGRRFHIGDGRNEHRTLSQKEGYALRRVHMVLNLISERRQLTD